MQHPDETLVSICMKHLKHLKHMLTTYMYMQHLDLLLQYIDKTLATFSLGAYKIIFRAHL